MKKVSHPTLRRVVGIAAVKEPDVDLIARVQQGSWVGLSFNLTAVPGDAASFLPRTLARKSKKVCQWARTSEWEEYMCAGTAPRFTEAYCDNAEVVMRVPCAFMNGDHTTLSGTYR
jgi:hypothetical protein